MASLGDLSKRHAYTSLFLVQCNSMLPALADRFGLIQSFLHLYNIAWGLSLSSVIVVVFPRACK
jgi:hypothetical protein